MRKPDNTLEYDVKNKLFNHTFAKVQEDMRGSTILITDMNSKIDKVGIRFNVPETDKEVMHNFLVGTSAEVVAEWALKNEKLGLPENNQLIFTYQLSSNFY